MRDKFHHEYPNPHRPSSYGFYQHLDWFKEAASKLLPERPTPPDDETMRKWWAEIPARMREHKED